MGKRYRRASYLRLGNWQKWEVKKKTGRALTEDIGGIADAEKLPTSAKEFLSRLEKHLGVPVLLVGTGPGREQWWLENRNTDKGVKIV